jgi:hypothetical protein
MDYIKLIARNMKISYADINEEKQKCYAKIKHDFFSLKYEHIILEDKICELALMIAVTRIVQNQLNVNHLWKTGTFIGDISNSPNTEAGLFESSLINLEVLVSDVPHLPPGLPHGNVPQQPVHIPHLPTGLHHGHVQGDQQQLGGQAVPHQPVHLSPLPPGLVHGHVQGDQQQLGGQAVSHQPVHLSPLLPQGLPHGHVHGEQQ